MISIPAREKILFHLYLHDTKKDKTTVPFQLCQKGLSDGIGVSRPRISQLVNELKEKGYVKEEKRHLKNFERKRKVYFLSQRGRKKVRELLESYKDESIKIHKDNTKKEIELKQISEYLETDDPILHSLISLEEDGKVNLSNKDELGKSKFIGRKREIEKIKRLLNKAKKGRPKIIFIEGYAGIGKTRLIKEIEPHIKNNGFEYLSATCQSENADPYLPFKEAFEKYFESESLDWIIQKSGENSNYDLFDVTKKSTFYEALNFIKKLASEKPVAIFFDDIQWADQVSLDLISYIMKKIKSQPIIFIGTYRPEDIDRDHYLSEILHRLGRESLYEKIELETLDFEDTKRVIQKYFLKNDIPEQFYELLYERTDGNPLFIKESLKYMMEKGKIDPHNDKFLKKHEEFDVPNVAHHVIKRRIDDIKGNTKKIMNFGSIMSDKIRFEILAEGIELDENDIIYDIDELLEKELWVESENGDHFLFSHKMIEEVVYNNIPKFKRKFFHRKIGETIENTIEDKESEFEKLANHFKKGEDYGKSVEYFFRAGKKAEDVYAYDNSIEMYKEALLLLEKNPETDIKRENILFRLSDQYSLIGDYQKSIQYLKEILEISDDDNILQKSYRKLAKISNFKSEYQKVIDYCEKGLGFLSKNSNKSDIEECKLLSKKGWAYLQIGQFAEAKKAFEKEKKISKSIEDKTSLAKSYHDLGTLNLFKGDCNKSIEFLEKSISLREKMGDKKEKSKSLNNLGNAYFRKEDLDRAVEKYKESLEIQKKMGNIHHTARLYNNLGTVNAKKGENKEALKNYNKSLEIQKDIGDKQGMSKTLHNIGEILIDKGEIDKAKDFFERSLEIMKEIPSKYQKSLTLNNLGSAYLKKGNLNKSLKKIKKAKEISKEIEDKRILMNVNINLGKVKRKKGDVEFAIKLHKDALDEARQLGADEIVIISLLNLAEDYLEMNDLEAANEVFKEAEDELNDIAKSYAKLLSFIVKSKILRNKEKFDEALETVDKGLDVIDEKYNKELYSQLLFQKGKIYGDMKVTEESLKFIKKAKNTVEDTGFANLIKKYEKALSSQKNFSTVEK